MRRVCNADQQAGPLLQVPAIQVHHSMLCYHIVYMTARGHHSRVRFKCRHNTGDPYFLKCCVCDYFLALSNFQIIHCGYRAVNIFRVHPVITCFIDNDPFHDYNFMGE